MTRLGRLLTAYEQKHDLSSQSVADELGINKSTYSRIKNGKLPDAKHFMLIMNWALGEVGE